MEQTKRMASMTPGGLKGIVEAMQKIDGFPIETDMGTMMTSTVTKVEMKTVGASEFEVPAGYTKVDSKLMEKRPSNGRTRITRGGRQGPIISCGHAEPSPGVILHPRSPASPAPSCSAAPALFSRVQNVPSMHRSLSSADARHGTGLPGCAAMCR